MKYFKDCTTIDEVNAQYKKLAKEYHPDAGGDTATMQEINREYSYTCAHITKGEGMSDEEADTAIKFSEEYRKVIEQIIHLPDIIIEAVGHWIWVTGNTYPVRKELKEAGLFFAHKKGAWYYRSELYKTRGGNKTLPEIKAKYGSETINRRQEANILED